MSESTRTLLVIGVLIVVLYSIHEFGALIATPRGRVCYDPAEVAVLNIGDVLSKYGGDPGVLHLDLHRDDHEWVASSEDTK
jgi:hypothetical protein